MRNPLTTKYDSVITSAPQTAGRLPRVEPSRLSSVGASRLTSVGASRLTRQGRAGLTVAGPTPYTLSSRAVREWWTPDSQEESDSLYGQRLFAIARVTSPAEAW